MRSLHRSSPSVPQAGAGGAASPLASKIVGARARWDSGGRRHRPAFPAPGVVQCSTRPGASALAVCKPSSDKNAPNNQERLSRSRLGGLLLGLGRTVEELEQDGGDEPRPRQDQRRHSGHRGGVHSGLGAGMGKSSSADLTATAAYASFAGKFQFVHRTTQNSLRTATTERSRRELWAQRVRYGVSGRRRTRRTCLPSRRANGPTGTE